MHETLTIDPEILELPIAKPMSLRNLDILRFGDAFQIAPALLVFLRHFG